MQTKPYPKLEVRRLQNVALSFSGGGFRAASYALGCLSFLEKLNYNGAPFMSLVRFISSASGGTLTAMAYTAGQREGMSFAEFFRVMTEEYLLGEKLINRVFEVLADDKAWKERHVKTRNLINAFALVYDDWVFKRKTFGLFFRSSLPGVSEVCFNTTEFKNGMLLRFQNRGVLGNSFIKFKRATDQKKIWFQIKLGDILACSSCFPVGFEPVTFPQDFAYCGLTRQELSETVLMDDRYWNTAGNTEPDRNNLFSLMDGGIDDNQGIYSFLRAEERLQKENGFGYDLYVACDVSSNYTKGFYHAPAGKQGFFGSRSLRWYLWLIVLVLLFCLAGILTKTLYEPAWMVAGVCVVILSLARWTYLWLENEEEKARKTHGTELWMLLRHRSLFFKLGVGYIAEALLTRGKSAAELAAVVFMKKIRRLSYDSLFEAVAVIPKTMTKSLRQQGVEKKLKFLREFVLQNALYLLSEKNALQQEADLKKESWVKRETMVDVSGVIYNAEEFIAPSEAMVRVATLGTAMETTLWYDGYHEENFVSAAILASGQFTTCYNLLKYALRFEDVVGETVWQDFRRELVDHLGRFKKNPFCMYNDEIAGSKVLARVKMDGNNIRIIKG